MMIIIRFVFNHCFILFQYYNIILDLFFVSRVGCEVGFGKFIGGPTDGDGRCM